MQVAFSPGPASHSWLVYHFTCNDDGEDDDGRNKSGPSSKEAARNVTPGTYKPELNLPWKEAKEEVA